MNLLSKYNSVKQKRNILKHIKKLYQSCKDSISPLPTDIRVVQVLFLIFTVATFISYIGLIIYQYIWLQYIVWGDLFIVIILIITNHFKQRKHTNLLEKRRAENRELLIMVLADIAKKYSVTPDQLVLYLVNEHKSPWYCSLFSSIVSVGLTAFSLRYLPSYDVNNGGIVIFCLLLIMNLYISKMASMYSKEINMLDDFDFYSFGPYEEIFKSIDRMD